MRPIDAVKSVLGQYADASGRASRSEFWWWIAAHYGWILLIIAIVLPLSAVAPAAVGPVFIMLWVATAVGMLLLIAPNIAVMIRRLHDTGRSGAYFWTILIPFVGPIVLIVLWALPGEAGENMYGPPPG